MQPNEENTYADIEAVYQCLETEYGISQEDIILYGQSVGSGPTLHLASRLPRLRGVVLHSAILSGLRVVCHVNFTFCFDIYKVKYSSSFLYLRPGLHVPLEVAFTNIQSTHFCRMSRK
jgi:pimeloyl-ACP methyl ester carboxylesterase